MHFPVYIPGGEEDSGHWEFCKVVVAEHEIILKEFPLDIEAECWHKQDDMLLDRWRLIVVLVSVQKHMSLLKPIIPPPSDASSSQSVACSPFVNGRVDYKGLDVIAWCDFCVISTTFLTLHLAPLLVVSSSLLFHFQVIDSLCLIFSTCAHIGAGLNSPYLLTGL